MNNLYIKLIYFDLRDKAKNGILTENEVKDICLNPSLKEIYVQSFDDDFIWKNVKSNLLSFRFLTEGGEHDFLKLKKIKVNKGDFLFPDVLDQLEKELLFDIFYTNGIDPFFFLKTLLKNTVNDGRKKYCFEDLLKVLQMMKSDQMAKQGVDKNENIDDLITQALIQKVENDETIAVQSEQSDAKKFDFFIDPSDKNHIVWTEDETVSGLPYLKVSTEKWFDVAKIEKRLEVLTHQEEKSLWSDLKSRFEREGQPTAKASAMVAKLIKDHGGKMVFKHYQKLKDSNSPQILPLIINSINQEKNTDNDITSSYY